jgi:MFS-type transporter involved in bile tolerance (Atg22 family)
MAIGIVSSALFVAAPAGGWFLVASLYIVSNVAYGASYVYYNAALPQMARAHPDYIESGQEVATLERVISSLSQKGSMWSFTGAVVGLILAVALQVLLTATDTCSGMMSFAWMLAFTAAWWLVFGVEAVRRMVVRPAPPLPAGVRSKVLYSWWKTWQTAKQVAEVGVPPCSACVHLCANARVRVRVRARRFLGGC